MTLSLMVDLARGKALRVSKIGLILRVIVQQMTLV